MLTAGDLLSLDRRGLARVFEEGHALDAAALDDTEYLGTSLGLPRLVERLTWKRFKKVFHREPKAGALRGWNIRLEQPPGGGVGAERFAFGHFSVVDPPADLPPARRRGVLLDYGLGGRAKAPFRWIRDPLVSLRPGSADLLLGFSYMELGGRRLDTPTWFCLERRGPMRHVVEVDR